MLLFSLCWVVMIKPNDLGKYQLGQLPSLWFLWTTVWCPGVSWILMPVWAASHSADSWWPPLEWSSFCQRKCARSLMSLNCLFSRSHVFSLVAVLLLMDWLICIFLPFSLFWCICARRLCFKLYQNQSQSYGTVMRLQSNIIHYCHKCCLFYCIPPLNINSTDAFPWIIPRFIF